MNIGFKRLKVSSKDIIEVSIIGKDLTEIACLARHYYDTLVVFDFVLMDD
jgi:hypothetical protein